MARARTTADRDPSRAFASLRGVLEDIERPAVGEGLGSGLADWASARRIRDQIEQPVIEAALLVADLGSAQGPDGHVDAVWALDQALKACPTNEAVIRAAMRLDAHRGDRAAANGRWTALVTELGRDDLEPEPETTQLRRDIMSAGQPIG